MNQRTTFINPPCPHLPDIVIPLPINHTRVHREECSVSYFNACIELAQSLWKIGSPAQAILQLDKSMMADSSDGLLDIPYQPILWIIENAPKDQFLGNPVRHFQHLASRMNMKQPNADIRIWRAWACLYLVEATVKNAMKLYPRDDHQIKQEDLIIPDRKTVLERIETLASVREADTIRSLF